MLTYNFENRGNLPIYEYLYNCIKEDILKGIIKANEKLPSKRQMAKNHGISVITVENAYAQLLVEGYIYSKEKRGYFATEIKDDYNFEESREVSIFNESKDKKEWLVDFNSNNVKPDSFPFGTWSKVMRQTLLDEENNFLESPNPNGVFQLRMQIANHLKQFRGLNVNPDNIIVGAGMEYLYGIIVKLFGNNKIIAVEDPGYRKIGKVYESNGVRCMHLEIDGHGVRPEDLENTNSKAVHISPSHHFPTGRVMPITRRRHLIQWAIRRDAYIIEDDYDSEFRFQGKPIPAMAGMNSDRVIYMNTFSKTLAPSIRIAYMILPEKLMEEYNKKLNYYSSTVSSFEQYTLANFIAGGYYERHINRMRNYYKDYRKVIVDSIKNSSIANLVTIKEDKAGLHLILQINKEINDDDFKEKLKNNNINISSVSDYCYNELANFDHQFIINYSDISEECLKEALLIMEQALN